MRPSVLAATAALLLSPVTPADASGSFAGGCALRGSYRDGGAGTSPAIDMTLSHVTSVRDASGAPLLGAVRCEVWVNGVLVEWTQWVTGVPVAVDSHDGDFDAWRTDTVRVATVVDYGAGAVQRVFVDVTWWRVPSSEVSDLGGVPAQAEYVTAEPPH